MNLRAAAARVMVDVLVNGFSLTKALSVTPHHFKDTRDRALLQAICYGVCRWYFKLKTISQMFLQKPLKQKDFDIDALILVGLYQLIDLQIPAYAAIAETVSAAVDLKKPWAKGLINAVLREYKRKENELPKLKTDALYSHPDWMIKLIKKNYPSDFETILIANNQYPPFSLRVNKQRITRDNYLKKLANVEMHARIIPETQSGIILSEARNPEELPGFFEGEVTVQDGAAQLAAELLDLKPKQRVLDACAAPGGKTTHILELQPTTECIAVDQDAARLKLVTENMKRLNVSAQCINADVGDVKQWWDGILFDRILLDVPCSASGVIRRHPDIKLRRQAGDIAKFADTQLQLLTSSWNLLKPGGILLYVTCSIFSEENTQVLQQFLAEHPAREEKITETWGINCSIGKQILPGMHSMDGFYFARLRK